MSPPTSNNINPTTSPGSSSSKVKKKTPKSPKSPRRNLSSGAKSLVRALSSKSSKQSPTNNNDNSISHSSSYQQRTSSPLTVNTNSINIDGSGGGGTEQRSSTPVPPAPTSSSSRPKVAVAVNWDNDRRPVTMIKPQVDPVPQSTTTAAGSAGNNGGSLPKTSAYTTNDTINNNKNAQQQSNSNSISTQQQQRQQEQKPPTAPPLSPSSSLFPPQTPTVQDGKKLLLETMADINYVATEAMIGLREWATPKNTQQKTTAANVTTTAPQQKQTPSSPPTPFEKDLLVSNDDGKLRNQLDLDEDEVDGINKNFNNNKKEEWAPPRPSTPFSFERSARKETRQEGDDDEDSEDSMIEKPPAFLASGNSKRDGTQPLTSSSSSIPQAPPLTRSHNSNRALTPKNKLVSDLLSPFMACSMGNVDDVLLEHQYKQQQQKTALAGILKNNSRNNSPNNSSNNTQQPKMNRTSSNPESSSNSNNMYPLLNSSAWQNNATSFMSRFRSYNSDDELGSYVDDGNSLNTEEEDELYRIKRLTSWDTLRSQNTNLTHETYETYLTADASALSGAIPSLVGGEQGAVELSSPINGTILDDSGAKIDPELLMKTIDKQRKKKRVKTKVRRKKFVNFEYPPVSKLRECPRYNPDDMENLFFTEEELDQIEDDRYSTKIADDIEVVAVVPSNSQLSSMDETEQQTKSPPSSPTSVSSRQDVPPTPPNNGFNKYASTPSRFPLWKKNRSYNGKNSNKFASGAPSLTATDSASSEGFNSKGSRDDASTITTNQQSIGTPKRRRSFGISRNSSFGSFSRRGNNNNNSSSNDSITQASPSPTVNKSSNSKKNKNSSANNGDSRLIKGVQIYLRERSVG